MFFDNATLGLWITIRSINRVKIRKEVKQDKETNRQNIIWHFVPNYQCESEIRKFQRANMREREGISVFAILSKNVSS